MRDGHLCGWHRIEKSGSKSKTAQNRPRVPVLPTNRGAPTPLLRRLYRKIGALWGTPGLVPHVAWLATTGWVANFLGGRLELTFFLYFS